MTVGIVGLGLIGGSFAKAYQRGRHGACWAMTGTKASCPSRSWPAPSTSRSRWTISARASWYCCRVRPLAAVEYLRQAAPHIGGKPVVIDCCGTKRVVCAAAFPLAKEYGFTYLGGHPMAGTQYSGFGHARANLYHNAPDGHRAAGF